MGSTFFGLNVALSGVSPSSGRSTRSRTTSPTPRRPATPASASTWPPQTPYTQPALNMPVAPGRSAPASSPPQYLRLRDQFVDINFRAATSDVGQFERPRRRPRHARRGHRRAGRHRHHALLSQVLEQLAGAVAAARSAAAARRVRDAGEALAQGFNDLNAPAHRRPRARRTRASAWRAAGSTSSPARSTSSTSRSRWSWPSGRSRTTCATSATC